MRETLEQAQDLVFLPLLWVSTLPDPKSAQTVLNALKEIPPRERLLAVLKERSSLSEVLEICTSVAERGGWEDKDKDALREAFQELLFSPDEDKVPEVLDVWSRPGLFGEQYLSALEAYYKAFFAEEEKRINSVLEKALNSAQLQARELAFPDLIKSLSRGVRLAIAQDVHDWVMVPSYWISPLVVYQRFDQEHGLFLFGGRPDEEALVPGDQVPDTMLRALKTLANPTRLKILRYLAQENMSPTELAQRLRLRAPTVTHHLKKLRLAGLVYLTLSEKKKKCYTTRAEAVENTFQALETFLGDK